MATKLTPEEWVTSSGDPSDLGFSIARGPKPFSPLPYGADSTHQWRKDYGGATMDNDACLGQPPPSNPNKSPVDDRGPQRFPKADNTGVKSLAQQRMENAANADTVLRGASTWLAILSNEYNQINWNDTVYNILVLTINLINRFIAKGKDFIDSALPSDSYDLRTDLQTINGNIASLKKLLTQLGAGTLLPPSGVSASDFKDSIQNMIDKFQFIADEINWKLTH
ncbi:MAG: hypothetical protein Q8922_04315 [Bacteroidota bacterium]|nr:hypothetical protein [Bacteroidota bacterium]MDP4231804.1 hypothetical protein [Bacteroidota bacterium]MDP4242690.1 hypothetical protein [Bacteroidota bacterium]MDP4287141.1 hypothetical protein [Bacteroidota bacterium]